MDASVRKDGTLLDWAFVDVDGSGREELVIAVRTQRGERELHLHRVEPASIDPAPYAIIPILKDIIAWSFADVRPELDGRELILLTRQGAWSFDPRSSGYKGNIQKLLDVDLLYDVPSPRALPYWSYVIRSDARGGERLLLPDRSGFRTYGPNPGAAEGEQPWHATASFRRTSGRTPADPDDQEGRRREAQRAGDRRQASFSVTVGDTLDPVLGTGQSGNLIEDEFRLQAPALYDVDGDGRRDMLLMDEEHLNVHIATDAGIPERPTRVEALPDYLKHDGTRAALRVVDIDGDGRKDLLGIWSEDVDGFENAQWRIFVLRST
ncbi:MAG TPA: VCBS repeat-containing protein, partial [Pseudomonadales bacterium]|nr:VCBS repeat-containing protein [Pseudomonadales bacterium]